MWYIYLCILTFMLLIMSTNSRYLSKAKGNTNIQIAEPVIEMVKITNTSIEVNCEEKEIEFEVKNKNTLNKISDVTFKYQLSMTTDNGMPVEYKLYKQNGGTKTEITVNNGITEELLMLHSVEQIDSFVLYVRMNDKTYQGEIDNISILLTARQINESEI